MERRCAGVVRWVVIAWAAAFSCARAEAAERAGLGDERRYTDIYLIDDGVGENSAGVAGGGHMGWINEFEVKPGLEVITGVRVAFGLMQPGAAFKVYVWSDPNQDGEPSDAVVLTSGSGVALTVNSDVFTTVDVPDKQAGEAGERFFVGVLMEAPVQQFPARIDLSHSLQRSWYVGGGEVGIDPSNIGGAEELIKMTTIPGLDGNWMVRANAIPGPGGAALLAPAVALLVFRGRPKPGRGVT